MWTRLTDRRQHVVVGGVVICLLLGCQLSSRFGPTLTPPPEPVNASTPVVLVVTATEAPLWIASPSGSTPAQLVMEVTPTPLPDEAILAVADVEEQLITAIYEHASPAVVHITSKVIQYTYFWGPVPQEGTGSGFIIDKEGHIVTNEHVVSGAEEVEVALSDRTVLPAEIVGTDPYNDLAVLKVDEAAVHLAPLRLGTSEGVRVGQRAIAIGNPFGLDRTLTVGVISSLGRIIEREGQLPLGEAIQTDAAINPGNSGGPLLDSRGTVIGVNTAIKSPTGGSVGIGFAVPVDAVQRVVPELIEKGYYAHPWLGFEAYAIVPRLARGLRLPVDDGLLITRIYRNSPAQRAGLQGADREERVGNYLVMTGGDIVTSLGDTAVDSMEDLVIYLETKTRVGDQLPLTVWHEGREQQVVVTVGERPLS
jgi:S1-C subfamily serine protease